MMVTHDLKSLSFLRLTGLIRKEFILIFRDRGTIAMLIIMPIMLLILFGFAIDLDPKHLPTTVISYDHSPLTRALVSNLQSSQYFNLMNEPMTEIQAKNGLSSGRLSYVLTIPNDFTRKFIRGDKPELSVEFDGSDPGSSASALSHIQPILDAAISQFTTYGLTPSVASSPPREVSLVTHRLYNETNQSSFDIVPGLIGVMLTMTMVMLTSTAITSEFESGTMEILLSTPLTPIEIIVGKVVPYVVLGYLQLTSILLFSKLLIHLPMEGSLVLLYAVVAPFMLANLMVGMMFSTLASTPMQAMQMSVFFQLPSMLLSGYFFSFYGMPAWAQWLGSCLPMTYFLRIARGLLLKGNDWTQLWPNVWPMMLITLLFIWLSSKIFRTTLD
jgi:ABC-2 type transport system permease protein